jgi:hypothetical protein
LRRAAAWSGLAGGDRGGARYTPLRLRDCFDYDASFGYALANIYDGETMNPVFRAFASLKEGLNKGLTQG